MASSDGRPASGERRPARGGPGARATQCGGDQIGKDVRPWSHTSSALACQSVKSRQGLSTERFEATVCSSCGRALVSASLLLVFPFNIYLLLSNFWNPKSSIENRFHSLFLSRLVSSGISQRTESTASGLRNYPGYELFDTRRVRPYHLIVETAAPPARPDIHVLFKSLEIKM